MSDGPKRIQLRRTKGWRKPEGAIVVSRPSRWGNPWQVQSANDGGYKVIGIGLGKVHWSADDKPWTKTFRHLMDRQSPRAAEMRAELAGKDLACWCPLDQPCHADVLLELANGSAA